MKKMKMMEEEDEDYEFMIFLIFFPENVSFLTEVDGGTGSVNGTFVWDNGCNFFSLGTRNAKMQFVRDKKCN